MKWVSPSFILFIYMLILECMKCMKGRGASIHAGFRFIRPSYIHTFLYESLERAGI